MCNVRVPKSNILVCDSVIHPLSFMDLGICIS